MPQPYNNAIITNNGAQLLTRAQAGEIKLEFTRIAIGSGTYTSNEKTLEALQARSTLKEQKNSYPLSNVAVFSERSVKVTALISNQDPNTGETLISQGYYINEIGLYAKPTGEAESTEVLYSVAVTAGECGDFMPPYNGYNPAQIIQDYYVTVSNAHNVIIQANVGAVALAEDIVLLNEKIIGLTQQLKIINDSFEDILNEKIINSLLVTEKGFALDARQGKVLNDKITELNGKLINYTTGETIASVTIGNSCEYMLPIPDESRQYLFASIAGYRKTTGAVSVVGRGQNFYLIAAPNTTITNLTIAYWHRTA